MFKFFGACGGDDDDDDDDEKGRYLNNEHGAKVRTYYLAFCTKTVTAIS